MNGIEIELSQGGDFIDGYTFDKLLLQNGNSRRHIKLKDLIEANPQIGEFVMEEGVEIKIHDVEL